MKVAYFSESPADEAALHILVQALAPVPVEATPFYFRRGAYGWYSVLENLPELLKSIHLFQQDLGALVVVLDSDETPLHQHSHLPSQYKKTRCRLCQLVYLIHQEKKRLFQKEEIGFHFHIGVGIAIPSSEAWYLFGTPDQLTEIEWEKILNTCSMEEAHTQKLLLKSKVYGTLHPSLENETTFAIQEAKRITQDLPNFIRHFSTGFGPLAQNIQQWDSKKPVFPLL